MYKDHRVCFCVKTNKNNRKQQKFMFLFLKKLEKFYILHIYSQIDTCYCTLHAYSVYTLIFKDLRRTQLKRGNKSVIDINPLLFMVSSRNSRNTYLHLEICHMHEKRLLLSPFTWEKEKLIKTKTNKN